jgi:hypothetical protein
MAGINLQLSGFVAANRDAQVTLVNQLTGTTLTRKPFLDGSLVLRDLDPGPYELKVQHPNLIQPIDQRIIRVFPQPQPTFVPITIPPDLFRDTPIRDIPDADLGPVQAAVTGVRDRLGPVGGKSPGEAIRAADWNVLVGAVADLASATLQLTSLVSPKGHDHPEIADKIAEVQRNLRAFAEAFGRSLLELQREVETESLRRRINDVVDVAQVENPQALRERLLSRVDDLNASIAADTATFTQKTAAAGNVLLGEVNQMAVAAGANADQFRAQPAVQALITSAQTFVDSGVQVAPENELQTYLRTTRTAGPKLRTLLEG